MGIPQLNQDGLYITGGPGTGKTHLAAGILADQLPRIVRRNRDGHIELNARWVSVPDVLLELRNTFHGNKKHQTFYCSDERPRDTELEIIEYYQEPLLLVLDDLGAEKISDWTLGSLYALISRRLNDCKPTIITSNLLRNELHAVDPRLASRIGGMTYFKLDGEDRRIAKSGQGVWHPAPEMPFISPPPPPEQRNSRHRQKEPIL